MPENGPVLPLRDEECYRAGAEPRLARSTAGSSPPCTPPGSTAGRRCPAVTPKRPNVSFFPTAAAAQQRGFRACKRCRPDASPGSPEWNVRADVVARAMRLIADGVVDRDGVAGLAARLGYSDRHLHRLVAEELGAGPLALARAQRAQTARLLIETTTMPMTDVAFAAGFSSVRQFNDTVREVFAVAARAALRGTGSARPAGAVVWSLRLAYRPPFDAASLFEFLGLRRRPRRGGVGRHDVPPVAAACRTAPGSWRSRRSDGAVSCQLRLESVRDVQAAVQRCRRLLDLDADPVAIDAQLGDDPVLAPLVATRPGLRSPGAVDGVELLVRAVLGQQVSVVAARTAARGVRRAGRRAHRSGGRLHHPSVPDSGVVGRRRSG